MNLDDIKKQATHEREKEASLHIKSRKQKDPKLFVPSPANSRKVFNKIYPHQPNMLI